MSRCFGLLLIMLLISVLCLIKAMDYWDELDTRWKFIKKAVCQKRPKYGKCIGRREMWYFDMHNMNCLKFTYSNCGGNLNRFYNKRECDEFCTSMAKEWIKPTVKK